MRLKTIVKLLVVLAAIAAAIWLLRTELNLRGKLRNLFAEQPVVIDPTPILVQQIRSVAELVTITTYDEVVVDSVIISRPAAVINAINRWAPVPILPSAAKKLVLICKGRVLAGVNLQQIDSSHVQVSGDTVRLRLPHPTILDAIINPTDFETFEETGNWKPEAVTALKLTSRQKMIDRAHQQGILRKANAKATEVLTQFLEAAGYKQVIVASS